MKDFACKRWLLNETREIRGDWDRIVFWALVIFYTVAKAHAWI